MAETETLNLQMAECGLEQRVLIAAPTGCDAEALCRILGEAGIETTVCATLEELCRHIEHAAAAAILAEEALTPHSQHLLTDTLLRQPEWSDFPLIVMAAGSGGHHRGWQLINEVGGGTHAILLQRPVRKFTLLSAVRAAIQSRVRQYQVRDVLVQRKQAEDALREADRRKDEFLATLAHELRNPLAPIRHAVEILKLQGSLDPTLKATRDIIDRQVQHMVRLIDDLLDISRITRGKLQLRRKAIELAEVLEQALETSRSYVKSAGHELTVSLPPQPVYLDADPVRLAQVFLNLIDNACKYTEKGGSIRLTAERDRTGVVVKITDTGIGISPENLPRLFGIFSQVGSPLERSSHGGLGIGLWLAQALVEMHGGSIAARSDGPGKGSEFTVWLPVLTETPTPQPPQPEYPDSFKATARRILVVDDNRDVVESLAKLLRLRGNEVETAQDGLEAVTAAEHYRPDVVLLDIGMPKLDGYGACRRMREQPWGKGIVIIALTGWGQDFNRRKTEEAGFSAHLVKPVELSALLQLLA